MNVAAEDKTVLSGRGRSVDLMGLLAQEIADIHCEVEVDDFLQFSCIDRTVEEMIKKGRLTPDYYNATSDEEKRAVMFRYQKGVYAMVSRLLAQRLKSKPDGKAAVVSETREQLAPESPTQES